MTDKYKLIGKLAVPAGDLLDWGKWFQAADRRVARTEIGPIVVSTVFLGIDHNFGSEGDPLLFETMIFGEHQESDSSESWCERTSTWGEAEEAHARAVAIAKQRLAAATA